MSLPFWLQDTTSSDGIFVLMDPERFERNLRHLSLVELIDVAGQVLTELARRFRLGTLIERPPPWREDLERGTARSRSPPRH